MTEVHPLGTVVRLWRYPVKSLRAEPLDRAVVTSDGFDGDRRRALFVTSEGHARSRKTLRGKEHNLLHTVAEAARAGDLAAERGIDVALRDDGPYFDLEPVSLVVDRWVEAVAGLAGCERLDAQRFRPNVLVSAEPSFAGDEASLAGRSIAIGTVRLRVVAPITRCVTPSYDVETGARDLAIARAIAVLRGNVLGVYCRVAVPGTIACGDAVTVT